METKILRLMSRLGEVEEKLGQSAYLNDQKLYRALTQEHAYLAEVKAFWEEKIRLSKQLQDNLELLKLESDLSFAEVLREDCTALEARVADLQKKLTDLLVPPDPYDSCNTILELRAGTGGDEAALFVGDCVRMYKLFSDKMGWRYDLLSSTESEKGGFKEYVMVVTGPNVYRFLRHEGGTHRVQRVPETEAQGRVHTSAITVAVLMEPEDDVDIEIDESELRVDTYRSSGAGGQHVNTTDSAVRLTHIPTGVVVYCQQERSQHKNKDKALRLLKAKLADIEMEKKQQEIANNRSSQVGSGDRSERIRTYNFPQNRISDHRINLTRYDLDRVMDGELEDIAKALVAYFHQEKLQQ